MSVVGSLWTGNRFHAAFAESEAFAEGDGAASSRREWLLAVLALGMVAADTLIVLGAFLLAYWVRFIVPDDEAAALGLHEYLRIGAVVGITAVVLLALHGVYDGQRRLTWPTRAHAIISAVSTALVVAVTVSYALGDQRFSRLWFAAGWAFAAVGLLAWQTLAQGLVSRVRTAIAPANRAVIVGANPLGRQLAQELAERFQVVGYIDNGSDIDDGHFATLPLLGPIAHLPRIVQEYAVDELVITLPADRREQLVTVLARGFRRRVQVRYLPDLGEILPSTFDIHHVGGRPYIAFSPVARVHWIKRATDLFLATSALVALLPLFLAIAVAIKLTSPGPVLFRQQRVGKHGRLFHMLKFRSMYRDAEQRLAELRAANEATGPLFKMRADPRVTRVGRFLRRTSLDELPQLLNVLRGEMSLVGPRPPLPDEVARYEPWQLGRLRAVPGMTGLWQVSGRSEVSFHDMVRLDLYYIRNWSLSRDLAILWQTLPAVISNRGAY